MVGPVGEIGRTDGTEWTGPVSGLLNRTVILIRGRSGQREWD